MRIKDLIVEYNTKMIKKNWGENVVTVLEYGKIKPFP